METITTATTTIYVVSFAPANDTSGSGGGFEWFYETNKDDALIHYGRMVEICGDESIVRLIAVPWDMNNVSDADAITDYLDSPEGLDDIEIKHMAMRENIPDTVDSIDRLPIHSRTPENIAKVAKNNNTAHMNMIRHAVEDENDIDVLVEAFDTMKMLNDDFTDGINAEYLRGQIELVANSPSIATNSEIVKEVLCDIVKSISGKDVS